MMHLDFAVIHVNFDASKHWQQQRSVDGCGTTNPNWSILVIIRGWKLTTWVLSTYRTFMQSGTDTLWKGKKPSFWSVFFFKKKKIVAYLVDRTLRTVALESNLLWRTAIFIRTSFCFKNWIIVNYLCVYISV